MIPAWTLAMMEAQAGPSFTPLDLGSKLIAWWKPPVSGVNVTLNGSAIADWTDEVGGYVIEQTDAPKQPAYDATGFGGGACAVFDGADDFLERSGVPASFPTGATPGEMWARVRQDAPADGSGARAAVACGTTGGSTHRRQLYRRVDGGVNRGAAFASGSNSINTSVDFSSTHTFRGVFGADVRVEVDGTAGPDVAATLATGTAGFTVGARPGAENLWLGAIREVLVTEPLTAQEAADLYAWLNGGS